MSQLSTLARGIHCNAVPHIVDEALANGMSMLTINATLRGTCELQPPVVIET